MQGELAAVVGWPWLGDVEDRDMMVIHDRVTSKFT